MNRIRDALRSIFLAFILFAGVDAIHTKIEDRSVGTPCSPVPRRLFNMIDDSHIVIPRGGSVPTEIAEEEVESLHSIKVPSSDDEQDEEGASPIIDSEDQHEDKKQDFISGGKMLPKDEILLQATDLRQKGKEMYDQGNWEVAADMFAEAASMLLIQQEEYENSQEENYVADYCTCRLHEALCRLKMDDSEACIEVCTSILNLEEGTSPNVRARAHHRRAKAHLQLGNDDEALEDARSAAFLGDRKAVALYGKLMRGSSSDDDTIASPPMLKDLLQGKNPFLQSSPTDSTDMPGSNPLLESLMRKSDPSTMMSEAPSLLGKGGTGGSLAKSLLASLTKRLESDPDSLCEYLQKADSTQIQSLASLAGVPISKAQSDRLAQFCHAITPKLIRVSIKLLKGGWYTVRITRKTAKVINKYKHILILWALFAWIQSAIRRPIPIPKKGR